MKRAIPAIVMAAALLAGCGTPGAGPTPTATPVEVAVRATVAAPATSIPAPPATPTISPANEGCVRATTEIPEGQNPTHFMTSGPPSGCYETVGDFLDDIGLAWEEFAPGTGITVWTEWPVDAEGSLVYPSPPQLAPWSASVSGVGEHGGMVCLEYEGDQRDLEDLTFTADIGQGHAMIDNDVMAQSIDGRSCFELTDAEYRVGQPVILRRISITTTSGQLIESSETLELDNYVQYPFLGWIFPEELGLQRYSAYTGQHPALDFRPHTNESYPSVTEIPVLSPVTGRVGQVRVDDPNKRSVNIDHPYTGFVIHLGHLADNTPNGGTLGQLLHPEVSIGEPIAFIGAIDIPPEHYHVHMFVAARGAREDHNEDFTNLFLAPEVQTWITNAERAY